MDNMFSVGRVILLVYLILASGYCSDLFSEGLKTAIKDNRMMQHLILLIMIITLMIMFGNPLNIGNSKNNIINSIIVGFIVYVWFILTTKLDLKYNVGILVILGLYFLFESYKINENNNVLEDTTLNNEKKSQLIVKFNEYQKYLLISIFGLTVIGTTSYLFDTKNKIQSGGGKFDYFNFFFDKS